MAHVQWLQQATPFRRRLRTLPHQVAVRCLLGPFYPKKIQAMKTVTLEQFLDLPWSDNVRHKLRVIADRDDVKHLVASYVDKNLGASVFTETPGDWPLNAVVWTKTVKVGMSKTMQAVQLVQDEGFTAYAAAKRLGINASAVHRALARREGRAVCPCCNQVIKDPTA